MAEASDDKAKLQGIVRPAKGNEDGQSRLLSEEGKDMDLDEAKGTERQVRGAGGRQQLDSGMDTAGPSGSERPLETSQPSSPHQNFNSRQSSGYDTGVGSASVAPASEVNIAGGQAPVAEEGRGALDENAEEVMRLDENAEEVMRLDEYEDRNVQGRGPSGSERPSSQPTSPQQYLVSRQASYGYATAGGSVNAQSLAPAEDNIAGGQAPVAEGGRGALDENAEQGMLELDETRDRNVQGRGEPMDEDSSGPGTTFETTGVRFATGSSMSGRSSGLSSAMGGLDVNQDVQHLVFRGIAPEASAVGRGGEAMAPQQAAPNQAAPNQAAQHQAAQHQAAQHQAAQHQVAPGDPRTGNLCSAFVASQQGSLGGIHAYHGMLGQQGEQGLMIAVAGMNSSAPVQESLPAPGQAPATDPGSYPGVDLGGIRTSQVASGQPVRESPRPVQLGEIRPSQVPTNRPVQESPMTAIPRHVAIYGPMEPGTAMDVSRSASGIAQPSRSHNPYSHFNLPHLNVLTGAPLTGNEIHNPHLWINEMLPIARVEVAVPMVPVRGDGRRIRAAARAGLSCHGHIYLGELDITPPRLHKYSLQWTGNAGGNAGAAGAGSGGDGGEAVTSPQPPPFRHEWSKELPFELSAQCRKQEYFDGRLLLQQERDNLTYLYSADMSRREKTLPVELIQGELSGCLKMAARVFKVKPNKPNMAGRRNLEVIPDDERERRYTLALPPQYKWRGNLSVCESEVHQRIVVASGYYHTLDVFHRDTKKFLLRINLPYEGVEENAVCCNDDFVFVAGQFQQCLFVYAWGNACQQMIPMREIFSFPNLRALNINLQDDLRIHGIHCADRQNVIIMTIGDSQEVKYLHAVKVTPLQTEFEQRQEHRKKVDTVNEMLAANIDIGYNYNPYARITATMRAQELSAAYPHQNIFPGQGDTSSSGGGGNEVESLNMSGY